MDWNDVCERFIPPVFGMNNKAISVVLKPLLDDSLKKVQMERKKDGLIMMMTSKSNDSKNKNEK